MFMFHIIFLKKAEEFELNFQKDVKTAITNPMMMETNL